MDKNILITTAPLETAINGCNCNKNAFIKKGITMVVVDLFTETHPKITEAIKRHISEAMFGKAYSNFIMAQKTNR